MGLVLKFVKHNIMNASHFTFKATWTTHHLFFSFFCKQLLPTHWDCEDKKFARTNSVLVRKGPECERITRTSFILQPFHLSTGRTKILLALKALRIRASGHNQNVSYTFSIFNYHCRKMRSWFHHLILDLPTYTETRLLVKILFQKSQSNQ